MKGDTQFIDCCWVVYLVTRSWSQSAEGHVEQSGLVNKLVDELRLLKRGGATQARCFSLLLFKQHFFSFLNNIIKNIKCNVALICKLRWWFPLEPHLSGVTGSLAQRSDQDQEMTASPEHQLLVYRWELDSWSEKNCRINSHWLP